MPEAAKNSETTVSSWQGTDEERADMLKDSERLSRYEMYKSPFKARMIEGVRKYSLRAAPLADKRISNILIPLVRMVSDSCISSMSAGSPSFNIRPRAISDYPKVNILRPAIEQVLEETNYESEQNTFLTDGVVMGTAGLEVYTQVPYRKDEDGKPVRDFSRPRIGIRARSGMELTFDPSLRNHATKGPVAWQDRIDEGTFQQDYAIVRLSNGDYKYKNCEFVKPGIRMSVNPQGQIMARMAGMFEYKGVVVDHIQDPIGNFYRIYANGVQILKMPLYMRPLKGGGHTKGDNALGDTRICVWANNDMYDDNDSTHSLYGAGEPWLMSGLDRMYQDFGNMMVDNYALANTFALTYKPGTLQAGGIDLDSTDFYSGMFIQGEIIKTNFGEANLRDFQAIKEIIDEWAIFLTGSNFKSLVGEQGQTAFEVATKLRENNKRYRYKLKKLEDSVFKKLGRLTIAAIFTTYTVDDFELVTGESRDELAQEFSEGKLAEDDLIFEPVKQPDGTEQKMIVGRKHKTMIKIPGRVYEEKLGKDKKRKLDGSIDSTLTEDMTKRDKADSFVPAAKEYLVTSEYAAKGELPGIIVDTSTMVAGKEQVELSDVQQLAAYAQQRAVQAAQDQSGGMATEFDMKKIDLQMTYLLNSDPDDVMKDQSETSKDAADVKKIDDQISMMEQMIKSPPLTNAPAQTPGSPLDQIVGGAGAPGAQPVPQAAPVGPSA